MGASIDEVNPIVKKIVNRKKAARRLKYVKLELIEKSNTVVKTMCISDW